VHLVSCVGIRSRYGRNIKRRRHILNDIVEHLLYSLVLVRRSAHYGNHCVSNGCLTDSSLDLLDCDLLFVAELLKELFVGLSCCLDHGSSVFLCLFAHILRDRLDSHIFSEVIVVDDRFHIYEVDNSSEGTLLTDRKLNGHGICAESFLHHVKNTVEVSSHYIHLVDISHSRDFIFVCLTPYGLRLGLNAALSAKYTNGSVKNSQRTLNLDSKVNVSGRIDDVYTMTFPVASCSSGGNCNTSFLLFFHPVHRCRTLVSFSQTVCFTRIEENSLSRGGLTGIDMSHDTDITCILK